jgi:hypothetical protein
VHCGVHGVPVGDFFLGRFVEDRADVPVSLEGCWSFCEVSHIRFCPLSNETPNADALDEKVRLGRHARLLVV